MNNPALPPVVATIGVFDGVHRGHRALLEVVLERARERGMAALAITFHPHPVSVFAPSGPPHLLTGPSRKIRLLTELGCDAVWLLPFSRRMADLRPAEFVEDLLLADLPLAELWVGYDFRFGRGREGDVDFLRREGDRLGFEVHQFGPVHERGRVLSSTWAREALASGDLDELRGILGHEFVLEGTVGRGLGQGARLLVPTANLDLPPEQLLPGDGVYAAWAELRGALLPAVVSIGVRPTLAEGSGRVVEAHLIGWEGNLRGELLALHFGRRLREQRRYPGLESLRRAIAADVVEAKDWLAGREPMAEPATPRPRPQDPNERDGTNI